MIRTIEQWKAIAVRGCADNYDHKQAIGALLEDAVGDMQELALMLDELRLHNIRYKEHVTHQNKLLTALETLLKEADKAQEIALRECGVGFIDVCVIENARSLVSSS